MDGSDLERVDSFAENLKGLLGDVFLHCAVEVEDWNRDLSPWEAPPVFGDAAFGSGAGRTLEYIVSTLLPFLKEKYDLSGSKILLGGYSLAALFALWAGYNSDRFDGIASASPSVWFNGWMDYIHTHEFHPKAASLSLGGKEAKTRNPTMAKVADCMDEQVAVFRATEGMKVFFEWNPGNHFKEPDLRTAKAFAALIKLL